MHLFLYQLNESEGGIYFTSSKNQNDAALARLREKSPNIFVDFSKVVSPLSQRGPCCRRCWKEPGPERRSGIRMVKEKNE